MFIGKVLNKIMSLTTVIVHWSGPYTLGQILFSEKGNGLYLLCGRQRWQKHEQIQYCGITEGLYRYRINDRHQKINEIKRDTLSIWLGEIIYPKEFKRPCLELAEHCFVSFWVPELNESKTLYYPRHAICFISQWFNCQGKPRLHRPSIVKELPDVLWWDNDRWRSGKLKIWPVGA